MIPVRNIYWMLAYAFRALEKGAYERLGSEEFDNAQELCAATLARGVESQIKRGLGRGYSCAGWLRDGLLVAEEGAAKAPGFFDGQAAGKVRIFLECFRVRQPSTIQAATI